MRLFRASDGALLEVDDGQFVRLDEPWDALLNRPDLLGYLRSASSRDRWVLSEDASFLAPVAGQEIWAAGVTYFRSRTARIEESQDAGTFYDRVYSAERPELFFKSAGWRVRGSGDTVRVRRDARWSVPEPELALVVNARGEIVGYTIGNDMSSRDIEGENPLYLPQAKIYDGSCALGPAVLVRDTPLPAESRIAMRIVREERVRFEGATTLSQMRRRPAELVEFLFREMSFPVGCVLLTGTGVIPPDEFTLRSRDVVRISIEGIGELVNRVE
jgi:2-dehydro-3-deoxy-D-arabinonate dehydratase